MALGIGVAVANGGVASATTDPDPSQDTSDLGQNPDKPTVDNAGTDTPQAPDGPEKPTVVINGVDQNDNEDATPQRRVQPRVMILDVLRGANIFGARRAEQNPDPVKQPGLNDEEQQPGADQKEVVVATNFAAPAGNNPVKQALPGVRALQRTIGAITASTQQKVVATKALPGPTKIATSIDTLTAQTQRQAAMITGPSTLAAPLPPPPPPRPSPVRFVLNLLSAVGLRPEAFPPGSPLAPVGQLLEFVYAGLRRIDHQLFNQAPTGTALVTGEDPVTHEQLGTNPTTGVVKGRIVGVDPDDALVYTVATPPATGTVNLNADGSFTYTPDYNKEYKPGATETFTVLVSEASEDHLHLSGGEHTVTVPVTVNLAPHNTVIATLPGHGTFPDDIVMDPDGSKFYVVYHNDSKVSVFNASTGAFIQDIPVGKSPTVASNPTRMAFSPDGKTAYVTNFSDPSVSVINLTTNAVTTFDTPKGAWDVAVLPNGNLYVVGSTDIAVVDPANPTAATFIPLAGLKGDITLSPDGKRAYVAIFDENRIAVIDTELNKEIPSASIPVGNFPQDVQVNPVNGTIYVGDDEVSVIPAGSTTATQIVVPDSRGLAVSPDGKRLYVANINFDSVSVIDTATNTVVTTIPIPEVGATDGPWRIAISSDGSRAYVVNTDGGTISVIALLTPA